MASHFPISLIVEESALGTVMKILHKLPGVVSFHVDMDAISKKSNGTGKTRVANAVDPVLAKIKGIVTRDQLMQMYTDAGGSHGQGARSSFVVRILAEKLIVAVPGQNGKYRIAAAGKARLARFQQGQQLIQQQKG